MFAKQDAHLESKQLLQSQYPAGEHEAAACPAHIHQVTSTPSLRHRPRSPRRQIRIFPLSPSKFSSEMLYVPVVTQGGRAR